MKRKAICPIPSCGVIFTVTSKRKACCCDEHQREWRKMQKSASFQRSIKPDDLDWANAMLEFAIDEIARLKSDNAILKMEKICADHAKISQNAKNEQKEPEKEQKSAPKSAKMQKVVENAQKPALAVEKIKRTSPEFASKTPIKGKGKYLKECQNCMIQFRTTDNRDKFCCDRCRMEYAREMGV